ncbi:glycosyltransferase family 4 protein [Oxynema aestuarii]|uniref:Glycosyltransferase family 4 protein n=1 Tax=Oxynema aestuarii AP17 TaxID=2064643 RepID=A0A6H1TVK1_9CYAN|nr:glycosyltransferase family 4 protein [Oxynema aestuarii]QIZ69359.1 glycosyltransferase family 4 protein [Oxynema aestuarii AP17]
MKIWIVNHYATSPERGSSTRHYSLAKELVKLGHQVTIIAAQTHHLVNSQYRHSPAVRLIEPDKKEGVNFLFLPTPIYKKNGISRLWNMLYFTWQVLQLPQELNTEVPDIVIGSSVHLFAVWAAERLANRFHVPFFFEVRDLWPQTLIDMKVLGKYHPLSIIFRLLEKYLYKKADKIITLLPYANEYIIQHGGHSKIIEYLPNGVELDKFKLISKNSKNTENFTVMYLGSHGKANALDTLIEAAARLDQREFYWRFIGEGPQKKLLQSKIEKLSLKNVKLEKKIKRKEVPQTMEEADILVLNLLDLNIYKYGISLNKLFEYLASSKPIVFGCAARNNPVAEANAGITVPPEDPNAMADAIKTLASLSPQERLEMGQRGRAYVEKYHSYQSLGKRLNTLIEEMVS